MNYNMDGKWKVGDKVMGFTDAINNNGEHAIRLPALYVRPFAGEIVEAGKDKLYKIKGITKEYDIWVEEFEIIEFNKEKWDIAVEIYNLYKEMIEKSDKLSMKIKLLLGNHCIEE